VASVTVRQAIQAIEADGWIMLKRTGTNHRQFRHPTKPGRVTISGNPGRILKSGTWANIRRQAGI
jgi:predicted RNA binding protein YcfA (HicA-like mRNA interferase family)